MGGGSRSDVSRGKGGGVVILQNKYKYTVKECTRKGVGGWEVNRIVLNYR